MCLPPLLEDCSGSSRTLQTDAHSTPELDTRHLTTLEGAPRGPEASCGGPCWRDISAAPSNARSRRSSRNWRNGGRRRPQWGEHDCGAGRAQYPARRHASPSRRAQDDLSHFIWSFTHFRLTILPPDVTYSPGFNGDEGRTD